jgi:ABC-type antimicrobial peptide transport system permease subunit
MATLFLSRAQAGDIIPWGVPSLIVRTRGEAARQAGTVRGVLQSSRPDLPYIGVKPLSDSLRDDVAPYQMGARVFSAFALLALMLAAVGLYGVLGYFVTERTAEIGIRRSLGAPVRKVIGLVVRQGMIPVTAGMLIGLAGSFAGTRYLASLLFGIEPRDLPSFVLAAVFLCCVAFVAMLLPAWRATRVDPLIALRQE